MLRGQRAACAHKAVGRIICVPLTFENVFLCVVKPFFIGEKGIYLWTLISNTEIISVKLACIYIKIILSAPIRTCILTITKKCIQTLTM